MALSRKPRILLRELLLEVSLTGRKHVVVEGPADRRFYRLWCKSQTGFPTDFTVADDLDLPADRLVSAGLNEGARSRVIWAAVEAASSFADIRFVADLDVGLDVDRFESTKLFWTDFPALESYGYDRDVLEAANELSFGGALADSAVLYDVLFPILQQIYLFRLGRPHAENPSVKRGLVGGPAAPGRFDVFKAFNEPGGTLAPEPEPVDRRAHVYGHDLGSVLMALYGNVLKNSVGISKESAVEGAVLSAMVSVRKHDSDPLFVKLRTWLQQPTPKKTP